MCVTCSELLSTKVQAKESLYLCIQKNSTPKMTDAMAAHKQKLPIKKRSVSLTPPPQNHVSERDARLIAASALQSLSAMKSGSSLKQDESGGTSTRGQVETKSVLPTMSPSHTSRGGVFADDLFSNVPAASRTPEIPLEGTSSCMSGPFIMDTPQFKQRTVECIKGKNLFPVGESTEESWTPLPYKMPHDGTMYAI